jgi:hypothetical protein
MVKEIVIIKKYKNIFLLEDKINLSSYTPIKNNALLEIRNPKKKLYFSKKKKIFFSKSIKSINNK